MNTYFPYLPDDATAYLYFWRSWWDNNGTDVIVWYQMSDGKCFCYCLVTGEVYEPVMPRQLIKRAVAPAIFSQILNKAVACGVLELSDQTRRFITTHYNDIIAIKTPDGRAHSYYVAGGRHADERANDVKDVIMAAAPKLAAFYYQEFRR